jgi:hypothetical protein
VPPSGWIPGGFGVVGLGVGSAFGVVTVSNESEATCDATGACSNYGAVGDAKSGVIAANVRLIAGGVLVATGAALPLFTRDGGSATEGRTASLHAAPVVRPGGGGVLLESPWESFAGGFVRSTGARVARSRMIDCVVSAPVQETWGRARLAAVRVRPTSCRASLTRACVSVTRV